MDSNYNPSVFILNMFQNIFIQETNSQKLYKKIT